MTDPILALFKIGMQDELARLKAMPEPTQFELWRIVEIERILSEWVD